MKRYHHACLATPPEVRTCGAFANEASRVEWVQPRDLWQGLLMRHGGRFTWNGHSFEYEPNALILVPPSSRCLIERSGMEIYLYSYFGFAPVAGERDVVSLPLHVDLDQDAVFWDKQLRKALNRVQTSRTSSFAVVTALLWAVAEPEHLVGKSAYVAKAEELVAARLDAKVRIQDLADELNVSSSQLTRLFLHEHGMTPLQYVLTRRAERAHQMLTRSTLPVKQVASACGMPNLHQFNRFVRDRFGASPRRLRESRGVVDIFRVGDYEKGSKP